MVAAVGRMVFDIGTGCGGRAREQAALANPERGTAGSASMLKSSLRRCSRALRQVLRRIKLRFKSSAAALGQLIGRNLHITTTPTRQT